MAALSLLLKRKPQISTIAIILLVALLIGLLIGIIYARVSSSNTVKLLNSTIATIRADNKNLSEQLKLAGEYIDGIEDHRKLIERQSRQLSLVLVASKETIQHLQEANNATREILDRSISDAGAASKLGGQAATEVDAALDLIKKIKADG